MANLEKYRGIIPAFYACYDDEGNVSPERVRALTEYHIKKGVKGVYVNGSSGECIYQSVEDRKTTLENVMAVATTQRTAWSWQNMRRAWAWMPLQLFLPSTSASRNMPLQHIGTP